MSEQRWIRGDDELATFDWSTPARELGVPVDVAHELFLRATRATLDMRRARATYLRWLREAATVRQPSEPPAPGRRTRAMRDAGPDPIADLRYLERRERLAPGKQTGVSRDTGVDQTAVSQQTLHNRDPKSDVQSGIAHDAQRTRRPGELGRILFTTARKTTTAAQLQKIEQAKVLIRDCVATIGRAVLDASLTRPGGQPAPAVAKPPSPPPPAAPQPAPKPAVHPAPHAARDEAASGLRAGHDAVRHAGGHEHGGHHERDGSDHGHGGGRARAHHEAKPATAKGGLAATVGQAAADRAHARPAVAAERANAAPPVPASKPTPPQPAVLEPVASRPAAKPKKLRAFTQPDIAIRSRGDSPPLPRIEPAAPRSAAHGKNNASIDDTAAGGTSRGGSAANNSPTQGGPARHGGGAKPSVKTADHSARVPSDGAAGAHLSGRPASLGAAPGGHAATDAHSSGPPASLDAARAGHAAAGAPPSGPPALAAARGTDDTARTEVVAPSDQSAALRAATASITARSGAKISNAPQPTIGSSQQTATAAATAASRSPGAAAVTAIAGARKPASNAAQLNAMFAVPRPAMPGVLVTGGASLASPRISTTDALHSAAAGGAAAARGPAAPPAMPVGRAALETLRAGRPRIAPDAPGGRASSAAIAAITGFPSAAAVLPQVRLAREPPRERGQIAAPKTQAELPAQPPAETLRSDESVPTKQLGQQIPRTISLGTERTLTRDALRDEAATGARVPAAARDDREHRLAALRSEADIARTSGQPTRALALGQSDAQRATLVQHGNQLAHAPQAASLAQAAGAARESTGHGELRRSEARSSLRVGAGESRRPTIDDLPRPDHRGPMRARLEAFGGAAQRRRDKAGPHAATPASASSTAAAASEATRGPAVDPARLAQLASAGQPLPMQLDDASLQAHERLTGPIYQNAQASVDQLGDIPAPIPQLPAAHRGHGAGHGGHAGHRRGGPDTAVPDTGPDTVGPDTVGPDTVGPDTVGPDTADGSGEPDTGRDEAIASIEAEIMQRAGDALPGALRTAAAPLQQELAGAIASAQVAADTAATADLDAARAQIAAAAALPPPPPAADVAAAAQAQHATAEANAATVRAGIDAEIAAAQAQAAADIAAAQAARAAAIAQTRSDTDATIAGQLRPAQAAEQAAAQADYATASDTARTDDAAARQDAAQVAAQSNATARAQAEADRAQAQQTQIADQARATAEHDQQVVAANAECDQRQRDIQTASDTQVAQHQTDMQTDVAAEDARGQAQVAVILDDGERQYRDTIADGQRRADDAQARADAEAAAKRREADRASNDNNGVVGQAISWVRDRVNDLLDAARAILEAARDLVISILEQARQAALGLLEQARQTAKAALDGAKQLIQGIITAAADQIRAVIANAAGLLRGLIQGLGDLVRGLASAFASALVGLVEVFRQTCDGILQGLTQITQVIDATFHTQLTASADSLRGKLDAAADNLEGQISSAAARFDAAVDQLQTAAIARVDAAERMLLGTVDAVEQTLHAQVDDIAQRGDQLIDQTFDQAHAVVDASFATAEAATTTYFNDQIARVDDAKARVDEVADQAIATANQIEAQVAETIVSTYNAVATTVTQAFVDFWNSPWRSAVIIGLTSIAAVTITVATLGTGAPIAAMLLAGVIGGTLAGGTYLGGEYVAREGEQSLSTGPDSVYIPGFGATQLDASGVPIPPPGLTEDQRKAFDNQSAWAVSNFNLARDPATGQVVMTAKSDAEIAEYARQEGIKGFGDGFIAAAGAMGGEILGGAAAAAPWLQRIASPVARKIIGSMAESGAQGVMNILSSSVGTGWDAGLDDFTAHGDLGTAFGAAWATGSAEARDPGQWVTMLASMGVAPIKLRYFEPLLDHANLGALGDKIADVAWDSVTQVGGDTIGAFVSGYSKAVGEGLPPDQALAAAQTAASEKFSPAALATTVLNTAAGSLAHSLRPTKPGSPAGSLDEAGATHTPTAVDESAAHTPTSLDESATHGSGSEADLADLTRLTDDADAGELGPADAAPRPFIEPGVEIDPASRPMHGEDPLPVWRSNDAAAARAEVERYDRALDELGPDASPAQRDQLLALREANLRRARADDEAMVPRTRAQQREWSAAEARRIAADLAACGDRMSPEDRANAQLLLATHRRSIELIDAAPTRPEQIHSAEAAATQLRAEVAADTANPSVDPDAAIHRASLLHAYEAFLRSASQAPPSDADAVVRPPVERDPATPIENMPTPDWMHGLGPTRTELGHGLDEVRRGLDGVARSRAQLGDNATPDDLANLDAREAAYRRTGQVLELQLVPATLAQQREQSAAQARRIADQLNAQHDQLPPEAVASLEAQLAAHRQVVSAIDRTTAPDQQLARAHAEIVRLRAELADPPASPEAQLDEDRIHRQILLNAYEQYIASATRP